MADLFAGFYVENPSKVADFKLTECGVEKKHCTVVHHYAVVPL